MTTPIKINLSVSQNQVAPINLSAPASQKADLGVAAPIAVSTGTRDYEKLKNKPTINGIEIVGDLTSADLGIDQTFIYEQNSASAEWHITHNLGKFPSVSVIDSAGTVVVGDVQYIDENKIMCLFSAPFIGTAYLN